MTEFPPTHYNGVAVLRVDKGAEMPWLGKRGNGEYAVTRMVDTLRLVDGTTAYWCAIDNDCDFIADTIQAITAGHGPKIHNSGNGGHNSRAKTLIARDDIMDMSLRDFIAFVAKHEGILSGTEDWRTRALAAERRLAAIEKHFD